MAEYTALKPLFSDIANAIREKDGSTGTIPAETFPDRIRGISSTADLTQQPAKVWTPSTQDQIISAETYLTGDQTIKGDANLIASNIKEGVSIFGIVGTYSPYATPGEDWFEISLPISSNWGGVAFGNNRFVIVPFSGATALYSDDGTIWHTTSFPETVVEVSDVAYGNNMFVAISKRAENGAYAYSYDGINWEVGSISGAKSDYTYLIYKNEMFIATTNNIEKYYFPYSEDGINWSNSGIVPGKEWYGIEYASGKFLAVDKYRSAAEIEFIYSTTGVSNWTEGNVGTDTSVVVIGLAASPSMFMVATGGGDILQSTDAVNWNLFNAYNNYRIEPISLFYLNGKFMCFNEYGTYLSTADIVENFQFNSTGISFPVRDMAFGNDTYVGIDTYKDSSKIIYSGRRRP